MKETNRLDHLTIDTAFDRLRHERDRKAAASYYSARSLRLAVSPFEAAELRRFDSILNRGY